MIDVVAAVNDEDILAANLLRSPMMARPDVRFHARRGFRAASCAYDDALTECTADLVVFAHQDVYLPSGWEQALRAQVARIERHDPTWAVLGVYGVTAQGRHVGCVWSSGLQRLLGEDFAEPVPVQSLDEVLIVLRRPSGVAFDPKLPGYHLYATDLVQAALDRGMGAYAVCAPVVHNSRPVAFLRSDYFAAYRYVARKWQDRLPIRCAVAPVMEPGLRYCALRARHKLIELRQGGRPRIDRGLDCVAIARELEFE
jgi:hypothetical protein